MLLRKLANRNVKRRSDFDPDFYRLFYPDARTLTDAQAAEHFSQSGKKLSRSPNAAHLVRVLEHLLGDLPDDFDEAQYKALHPDVNNHYNFAYGSAIHYLKHGRPENRLYKILPSNSIANEEVARRPAETGVHAFDPKFYRQFYPDAHDLSDFEAAAHFAQSSEKRSPNAAHMVGILEHMLGDLPAGFDEEQYKLLHPDVMASYKFAHGGAIHYLRYGRSEKRLYKITRSDSIDYDGSPHLEESRVHSFDPYFYRQFYPDARQLTDGEAVKHFFKFGDKQSRSPNATHMVKALEHLLGDLPEDFDDDLYKALHQDVTTHYNFERGGAIHYLRHGRAENRPYDKPLSNAMHYDEHLLHLLTNRVNDLPEIIVDPHAPVRFNVLVPAFEFKSMSAGFFGVFQVARFLNKCGYKVRLVLFDNFYWNYAEFIEKLKGYPDMEYIWQELEIDYIGERKAPLVVSPRDNCVATVWYSAHFAKKIMELIGNRKFLYLIQDYETNFFPGSTLFCFADSSYDFNYGVLFSTKTLQDTFVTKRIGRFGDENPPPHIYFNNACASSLTARSSFLHPAGRKKRLAFYSRPQVNRNMFELGALALCVAARQGVFDDSWEFLGVGMGDIEVKLTESLKLRQMERMNLKEYQEVISTFDVGLCLMASPHPSLLPFDLGGSGAIVVTNTFGLKQQAYFDGVCRNVIAVPPDLQSVVDGLADAVGRAEDRVARYEAAAAMNYPKTWDETFTQGHVDFVHRLFGETLPKGAAAVE